MPRRASIRMPLFSLQKSPRLARCGRGGIFARRCVTRIHRRRSEIRPNGEGGGLISRASRFESDSLGFYFPNSLENAKMSDKNFIADSEMYRKLCEPFPDTEAANDALRAFAVGVRELRIKHKIMDTLLCVRMNVIVGGDEIVAMQCFHNGSQSEMEAMAAYAMGDAAAQRQNYIGRMVGFVKKMENSK